VGFYREQVVPRVIDRMCGTSAVHRWRADVSEGLEGKVIEIGFWSGLNIDHYPAAVELVYAVEPSAVARRLAQKRVARSRAPVQFVGLDGQVLTLDDGSCDSALTTFTLCTIPDAGRALRELYRVMRPGAKLHFLEHGLSPDASVAVWQRRIEPLQRKVADGCHLTREPVAMIGEAGFRMETCDEKYAEGPRPWSWFSVGTAVKPTDP
jgi:ubiquinone/menaquinone biosynthesis C-methylase UbiE